MRELSDIRVEIDQIDEELLSLLNRRASLAFEVRAAKQKSGAIPADYYRPDRERSMLAALVEKNPGPLRDSQVKNIFQAIIASSLALQQPLKIAYLGPVDSESHAAVQANFGLEVEALAKDTIPAVFEALESDQVEFAVVPIEHLDQGFVVPSLEALIHSSLRLVGEVILNSARFIILGKTKIHKTGQDKTSLLITNIPNEPGALFRLFEPFHRHRINVSMPVLRPTKKEAWNYVFYLEVSGHEEDENLQSALADLKQFAQVKVIGSYPLVASIC